MHEEVREQILFPKRPELVSRPMARLGKVIRVVASVHLWITHDWAVVAGDPPSFIYTVVSPAEIGSVVCMDVTYFG